MCCLEVKRGVFLDNNIKSCCKAMLAAENWECPGMKVAWCGLKNEGQSRVKVSQGKGMGCSKLFLKFHL